MNPEQIEAEVNAIEECNRQIAKIMAQVANGFGQKDEVVE